MNRNKDALRKKNTRWCRSVVKARIVSPKKRADTSSSGREPPMASAADVMRGFILSQSITVALPKLPSYACAPSSLCITHMSKINGTYTSTHNNTTLYNTKLTRMKGKSAPFRKDLLMSNNLK